MSMKLKNKGKTLLKHINVFGPIVFVVIFFILGYLDSAYNGYTQTVSELVYSKFGVVQIINFFILIISILIFGLRFFSSIKNKNLKKLIFFINCIWHIFTSFVSYRSKQY